MILHIAQAWEREHMDSTLNKMAAICRRHFQMHIRKLILLISDKISLNYIRGCPINNMSSLVQIMRLGTGQATIQRLN